MIPVIAYLLVADSNCGAPVSLAAAAAASAAAEEQQWQRSSSWVYRLHVDIVVPISRRRDCHFADTPLLSILKHLIKVEGGAAE